ncbi:hypothetical protein GOY17_17305 [Lysobacter soli]|uniref:hypothetical protein n=1 Tax=Lysobacter soli TaxID=453783 RepID=UPI0012EE98BB|nr:hypothetical protein [Lysobacter soli]QGW66497.1 hypothetical protein GOY17_17305 [Lysobacter soli]
MRHLGRILLALGTGLVLWLFIGFEAIDHEHTTSYQFFLKQYPSWTVVYRNPVLCGECDLRRPENIGREANRRFEAFCRVRFDLDPGLCYAIYAMDQRRADERAGRESMRARFDTSREELSWAPGFPYGTPEEVVDFARSRNLCDYFRTEKPTPEQRERALELELGKAAYCSGTDKALARLRDKYEGDEEVARKLAEYDSVVEQRSKP